MKTFKKLLIWIVVILAIIVLVSFLLPSKYSVERSIVINADQEIIYDQICDFNNWENWTPWGKDMDSTAQYEIIGCCEVGAIQRWTGDLIGKGEMIITKLNPYNLIEYSINFDGGQYQSTGNYKIEPEGDAYKVTWLDEGELGYNPVARYMGLLMDGYMGPHFEKGLSNLKRIAEGMPEFPDLTVIEMEQVPAITIIDSSTINEMDVKMEEMYGELMSFMKTKRLMLAGHPYAVYYTWNPEGYSVFEAGMPVDKVVNPGGRINAAQTPGGKAVKAIYFGPYEGIGVIHEAIDKYIKMNGLEMAGPPWEVYVTDPMAEPDPAKWETDVFYPVK